VKTNSQGCGDGGGCLGPGPGPAGLQRSSIVGSRKLGRVQLADIPSEAHNNNSTLFIN